MIKNGAGKRKHESWIKGFIEDTAGLDTPEIFRKWAAITSISAALEQKVWLTTTSRLFPNLYVFLIAHPGVGKTRTIIHAKKYLLKIPEFKMSPNSMTSASLVDAVVDAKRIIVQPPNKPLEYNALTICVDEVGTFISKYDKDITAVLSAFYDQHPYGQTRRGNDLKIKLESPLLNILGGSTPTNLLELIPEGAWSQGFTSRIIFVFSDERIVGDDFATQSEALSKDLLHDLEIINGIVGEYKVTEDYKTAIRNWRALNEDPKPNHPKLIHYNTRRRVHLYKLSMISAMDRSNELTIVKDDFNRAMGWLLEAEQYMGDIFKAGGTNVDSQAQEEIYHFVLVKGKVTEGRLINFARERIPAHSVLRTLEIMEKGGMIRCVGTINENKITQRIFSAVVKTDDL
jgi:hypothetical protein